MVEIRAGGGPLASHGDASALGDSGRRSAASSSEPCLASIRQFAPGEGFVGMFLASSCARTRDKGIGALWRYPIAHYRVVDQS